MERLKLGFSDTYENAKLFFMDVLSRRYIIERDDNDPDYLIFGDANFGTEHYKFTRAKKIFFTGENVRPNYFTYNKAITFDFVNSPNHYRLPLYVLEMWAINKDNNAHGNFGYDYLWTNKQKLLDVEAEYEKKTQIVAYVQSNPNCHYRTHFANEIKNLGMLASAGPHLNTTGYILPRDRSLKLDFYNKSRYGIAIENGSYPGYVTEKLLDCYYANTIPIYWGSRLIERDFNPKSMINLRDFEKNGNLDTTGVFKYIASLYADKNRYCDMLAEPAFTNNIPNAYTNLDNFLDWWEDFVI